MRLRMAWDVMHLCQITEDCILCNAAEATIKEVDTSDWTPVRAAVPETGVVGESTCTPCPLNF
jgi:hypothetical protein